MPATTARKRDLLVAAYRQTEPLTLKYFVKVITRGLRIGLMARQVEEAIALACDVPHDAVRDAANRLGDLARVALAARHGELSAIEARLFHPMEFMLAKPLEKLEDLAAPADWIIEDKYDGIRSQVHYQSGYVRIYSRGMEEVTAAFPELKRVFETLPGNGLIDGEILAWRDGRALNFNVLQQRLARKNVRATLMAEVPVVFMGYDMLAAQRPVAPCRPRSKSAARFSRTHCVVSRRPYLFRLNWKRAITKESTACLRRRASAATRVCF